MTRMPQQIRDLRPLKTVELIPPDYRINPQHLLDSCVELQVKYSGIIPDIRHSIDATNRTEILRVIDRGKKEKYLPQNSQGAIFCLNVHNVKLLTRDSSEDVLLRLPIHQIAAQSYIREDDSHILAIKYGNCDLSKPQSDDTGLCHMVVLYCESQRQADELCSLVDQCFQMVYTEATMKFFDRNVMEGAGTVRPPSVDYSFTSTSNKSRESTPRIGAKNDSSNLGFLSYSSVDLGTSSSVTSRSLSRGQSHSSNNGELSSAASQLILDYMHKLYNKLNAEELQRFALLVKSWHSELSFPDFINSVLELYGPERQYLLVGMRPFIPAKDLAYFEQFIEHIGLTGRQPVSTPSAQELHGLSSTSSSHRQQSSLTNDSVSDFDMLNELTSGGMDRISSARS